MKQWECIELACWVCFDVCNDQVRHIYCVGKTEQPQRLLAGWPHYTASDIRAWEASYFTHWPITTNQHHSAAAALSSHQAHISYLINDLKHCTSISIQNCQRCCLASSYTHTYHLLQL